MLCGGKSWADEDDDYLMRVFHKVPSGDSPYVRAKHVQLVEKDPERAIALFWAAINAGDRVDSALKDMAIVMKQQNRAEEAIQAIQSFRDCCSDQAQEPLDNVLLDLYKRCGKLDEQIALLQRKLHLIHQGLAFNGKRTKTARSQGKKFQVSIEQEASRLLGNLGWAYMQKDNYLAAEAVYRKALSIQSDVNKLCNLGICLMKQGKLADAKATLESVPLDGYMKSHYKSYERAQEMLRQLEWISGSSSSSRTGWTGLNNFCSLSSSVEDSSLGDSGGPGVLAATSGFGPLLQFSAGEDSGDRVGKNDDQQQEQQRWWSAFSSSAKGSSYAFGHKVESRVPLTADWTNKQAAAAVDLRWGKLQSSTAMLASSHDEENIPAASKRCLFQLQQLNEAPAEDDGANWEFDPEVLLQELCDDDGDEDDDLRPSQHRLKVFEQIIPLSTQAESVRGGDESMVYI